MLAGIRKGSEPLAPVSVASPETAPAAAELVAVEAESPPVVGPISLPVIEAPEAAEIADERPAPRGDPLLKRVINLTPFIAAHFLALAGAIYTGVTTELVVLTVVTYYVRMFFITGAYHRYFAHRSYKTSRAFQFLLALGGTTASQKGVLWWAGHHRDHHRYSDTPRDIHSPVRHGLLWSHVGWILSTRYDATPFDKIRDFASYPELRWLNKYWPVPLAAGAVGLWLIGGLPWVIWGGLVSTVLLWHGTFTINSLSHVYGSRRYATTDESKNNFILALITLGEGWHNNHHHYQSSANQGFFWYEIDVSFMVIRLLGLLGIVWDIRTPPKAILQG
jgi:stearoyl-CoA desaturase (delta-9 desaturase)